MYNCTRRYICAYAGVTNFYENERNFYVCSFFYSYHNTFGRGSRFSFPQETDHLPHLRLSVPEKGYRLNCLLAPFGFEYQISQDIFVTRLDAWQRDYGYRSLYDRASPLLGMAFDCEPVYFDYQGKTWLLEFWKGQYGINTGAEIGIYRADTLLSPAQRPYTLFHTVPDEELPVFELEL